MDALLKPNQEPNLEKQRSQVLFFFATVAPLRIGSYSLTLVFFCILVIAAAHLPWPIQCGSSVYLGEFLYHRWLSKQVFDSSCHQLASYMDQVISMILRQGDWARTRITIIVFKVLHHIDQVTLVAGAHKWRALSSTNANLTKCLASTTQQLKQKHTCRFP